MSTDPLSILPPPKRRYHSLSPGHITLTEQLLHFLRKAPDRGVKTISMIAQRQIRRAAECAGILQSILYDIFLLPATHEIIPHLLKQGKLQATSIALHKHSIGVSPRFAFGSLLLLASSPNRGAPAPCIPGPIDHSSKSILRRLRQAESEYDRPTQTLALTHNFGHDYQTLDPAILAEIKQAQASPWPIILDETGAPSLLNCRIANRRRLQQQHEPSPAAIRGASQ